MNWRFFIVLCALLSFMMVLCREGHKKPKDSVRHAATAIEPKGYDPFTDTASLTTLLDRLITLQIDAAEGKEKSIDQLIAASYDTVAGCIYVVGTTAVVLDTAGEPNQTRNALLLKSSARRWALFEKLWITGQGIKFERELHGKVLYYRELLERRKNDTLEVLYMTPIGSIVVQ
jgi:hypothetical protein